MATTCEENAPKLWRQQEACIISQSLSSWQKEKEKWSTKTKHRVFLFDFSRLRKSESDLRRQRLASPTAQVLVAQTTQPVSERVASRTGRVVWATNTWAVRLAKRCHRTAWCNEIGSLTSLTHVTQVHRVTTENQFHCTTLQVRSPLSLFLSLKPKWLPLNFKYHAVMHTAAFHNHWNGFQWMELLPFMEFAFAVGACANKSQFTQNRHLGQFLCG